MTVMAIMMTVKIMTGFDDNDDDNVNNVNSGASKGNDDEKGKEADNHSVLSRNCKQA